MKGYSDWKNADARIQSHETSKDHHLNIFTLVEKQTILRIDWELVRQQKMEHGYWIKVLTRMVAVIQFLAERGLAFHGDSEVFVLSNNGNYLGCLELIAVWWFPSWTWEPRTRACILSVFSNLWWIHQIAGWTGEMWNCRASKISKILWIECWLNTWFSSSRPTYFNVHYTLSNGSVVECF